jgi:hypothetical protein
MKARRKKKVRERQTGSDDGRAVSPEEQYAILSAGRTIKDYLAGWNRRIGAAATENKRIVDDIIGAKLSILQRGLKSGSTTVDLKMQTDYIMQNKRLAGLNEDALSSYISLYLFHGLEEYRKTNRLKISYIVRK